MPQISYEYVHYKQDELMTLYFPILLMEILLRYDLPDWQKLQHVRVHKNQIKFVLYILHLLDFLHLTHQI